MKFLELVENKLESILKVFNNEMKHVGLNQIFQKLINRKLYQNADQYILIVTSLLISGVRGVDLRIIEKV